MTKRELKKLNAEEKVLKRCLEEDYILLDTFVYSNNVSKIHLRCNKDNHEWYVRYNCFVDRKQGCKKCNNFLKLSQEEVYNNINNRCIEMNYTLLNTFHYIDNITSNIHLKCQKDNYEWYTSYSGFIYKKYKCKKCQKLNKPSSVDIKNDLFNKCQKLNYTILDNFLYKNTKTKNIHLKCNIDNYEWYTSYNSFVINNKCCNKCGKSLKLTQEEAINNVLNRCDEISAKLLHNFIYTNNETRLYLKCNIDNFEWNVRYSNFINNKTACPECGKKFKKAEKKIKNLLEQNNIDYIYQYHNKDILYKQSFDFYLEKYNIAIEYQGGHHFTIKEKFGGEKGYINTVERDERKYNICIKNNINILYFTYEKSIISNNYFSKVYTDEQELIEEINRLINLKNNNNG